MQVILLKNVNGLGLVGDVVNVAKGYFRNYLFPRKMALTANPGSLKELAHQKRMVDSRKAQEKESAEQLKKQIESMTLNMERLAADNHKLFGSVTNADIATELEAKEIAVDRKLIKTEPIKSTGSYKIPIRLHPEVEANLNLKIVRSDKSEEVEETPAQPNTNIEKASETSEEE